MCSDSDQGSGSACPGRTAQRSMDSGTGTIRPRGHAELLPSPLCRRQALPAGVGFPKHLHERVSPVSPRRLKHPPPAQAPSESGVTLGAIRCGWPSGGDMDDRAQTPPRGNATGWHRHERSRPEEAPLRRNTRRVVSGTFPLGERGSSWVVLGMKQAKA